MGQPACHGWCMCVCWGGGEVRGAGSPADTLRVSEAGTHPCPIDLCKPRGKAFCQQKAKQKALQPTSRWGPSSWQDDLICRTGAHAARLLSHLPGEKGAIP